MHTYLRIYFSTARTVFTHVYTPVYRYRSKIPLIWIGTIWTSNPNWFAVINNINTNNKAELDDFTEKKPNHLITYFQAYYYGLPQEVIKHKMFKYVSDERYWMGMKKKIEKCIKFKHILIIMKTWEENKAKKNAIQRMVWEVVVASIDMHVLNVSDAIRFWNNQFIVGCIMFQSKYLRQTHHSHHPYRKFQWKLQYFEYYLSHALVFHCNKLYSF